MSQESLYLLGIIVGLTVVTIVTRSSFLVLGDYFPLPPALRRGLRFAPACALIAIVVPDLFVGATADAFVWNPRLIGAVAAIACYFLTRNFLAGIVGGMTVFWLVRWMI